MLAWVVIYRRHFTLSVPCEGLGPAGPFAMLLSTPSFPLPHLSPLLPVVSAILFTFLHPTKTQPFYFQSFPHSASKNTTAGRIPTRIKGPKLNHNPLLPFFYPSSWPIALQADSLPSPPPLIPVR